MAATLGVTGFGQGTSKAAIERREKRLAAGDEATKKQTVAAPKKTRAKSKRGHKPTKPKPDPKA